MRSLTRRSEAVSRHALRRRTVRRGPLASERLPNMFRPRVILILIASTIFTAAIGGFVFWVLAQSEEKARTASTQFAEALVKNDPSLAPKGSADHLEGLRRHFGSVTSARLVDARNQHVGSGDDG